MITFETVLPILYVTLLEFVVASSIVVLLIGVGVSQLNQKQHQAEKVIAQMQMVKAGMLRFNMDYPCSAAGLSALVKREDAAVGGCGTPNDLSQWKGPYIEGGTPLAQANINISSIYIDSFLELRQETIGGTYYQAIALAGTAESELRTSILAQCGRTASLFLEEATSVYWLTKWGSAIPVILQSFLF